MSTIYGGEEYNFIDSIEVSKRVVEEINKADLVYKGIVISGFPNNAVQANYIQKAGILPERYFVMHND